MTVGQERIKVHSSELRAKNTDNSVLKDTVRTPWHGKPMSAALRLRAGGGSASLRRSQSALARPLNYLHPDSMSLGLGIQEVRLEEFNLNRAKLATPSFAMPRLKSSLPRLSSRGSRVSAWTPRTKSAKPPADPAALATSSRVMRDSPQHMRWEAERQQRSNTRKIKRTAQVTSHRVELPYFMSGSNKPLHFRYEQLQVMPTSPAVASREQHPDVGRLPLHAENAAAADEQMLSTFLTQQTTGAGELQVTLPLQTSEPSNRPQTFKSSVLQDTDSTVDSKDSKLSLVSNKDSEHQDARYMNGQNIISKGEKDDPRLYPEETLDSSDSGVEARDADSSVPRGRNNSQSAEGDDSTKTVISEASESVGKMQALGMQPTSNALGAEDNFVTTSGKLHSLSSATQDTHALPPLAPYIEKQVFETPESKSRRLDKAVFAICTHEFQGKRSDVLQLDAAFFGTTAALIEDGLFTGVDDGSALEDQEQRSSLAALTQHLTPSLSSDWQLPMKYVFISPEQRQTFTNLFLSLDLDGNGRITLNELSKRVFHITPTSAQLKQFIRVFDLNRDRSIDKNEFVTILTLNDKLQGKETKSPGEQISLDLHKLAYFIQVYREMFELLDANGDGRLSLEELMVVVTAGLHPDVGTNQAVMQSLLDAMDADTRYVDFVEFLSFIPFFLQLHQAILQEPLDITNMEKARLAVRKSLRPGRQYKS